MKHIAQRTMIVAALSAWTLSACSNDPELDDEPDMSVIADQAQDTSDLPTDETPDAPEDTGGDDIVLSPELCDDPSNLQKVLARLTEAGSTDEGGLGMNMSELPKLLANPTERFYMVNLIKFRERAQYPDGRETNLTGREANNLYDPSPLINAMGGRIVYSADVDQQPDGSEDVVWESVAIVEYPCPIGLLAMTGSPEFQETQIHKAAGVETTRVVFTTLERQPAPTDPQQAGAMFPPTADDPSFDFLHIMDFRDSAQYEPDANEPTRTGEEAWGLYQDSERSAAAELGHYTKAVFKVNGTLIGENTNWNEVQLIRMSSQAGFQALRDDQERQAAEYHRDAALTDYDSVTMSPLLSGIPYVGEEISPTTPMVTPNGTGTTCRTGADCPDTSPVCISDGQSDGFCTPSSCQAGACEGSYVCCRDCNPAVVSVLPFESSACFPANLATNLSSGPPACTCD